MPHHFAEIAFTDEVKAVQERYGVRSQGERLENASIITTAFGFRENAFISQRDSFYLSTISATGWPYVQFRGGPQGFLKVLDEKTLGYADFRGNLQYISVGNLARNDRAAVILMDYPNRRRLKIYAHIRVADAKDDADLIRKLEMPSYKAKVERGMILTLEAFDWNCPQHITPRFTELELREAMRPTFEKLEALEIENQALRSRFQPSPEQLHDR